MNVRNYPLINLNVYWLVNEILSLIPNILTSWQKVNSYWISQKQPCFLWGQRLTRQDFVSIQFFLYTTETSALYLSLDYTDVISPWSFSTLSRLYQKVRGQLVTSWVGRWCLFTLIWRCRVFTCCLAGFVILKTKSLSKHTQYCCSGVLAFSLFFCLLLPLGQRGNWQPLCTYLCLDTKELLNLSN